MRYIVTTFALLLSLVALITTHWLTGAPKATMTIHATVPVPDGRVSPAGRVRFHLLNRSALSLLDSLCRLDVMHPPDQLISVLSDEGRAAFLRGAIERRGFVLSPLAARALLTVEQTRRAFLHHVRRLPDYKILLEAILRVRGPLADIPLVSTRSTPMRTLLPSVLTAEVILYNPAKAAEYADAEIPSGEHTKAQQLYEQWMAAVAAYEARYHRDLVERTIVAAAAFRNAAVASVETDTLGYATFPPIQYHRYWIAGHYPQEAQTLARLNRVLKLGLSRPPGEASPVVFFWDMPVEVRGRLPILELTGMNAVKDSGRGKEQ